MRYIEHPNYFTGYPKGVITMNKKIQDVECLGVEKRAYPHKHHVYVLLVTWSDGLKHPIYRKYSSFFDFQGLLKDQVQEGIELPELPALTLFERGVFFREGIAEKKKKLIGDFCKKILALPDHIVRSNAVVSFFEAWSSDFQHTCQSPKMQKKDKSPGFSILNALHSVTKDNKDNKENKDSSENRIPSPSGFDFQGHCDHDEYHENQCKVIATYQKRKGGEVDLHEGDIVDVLEKNLSGWWFVHVESTCQTGWAPGAFLEPLDASEEQNITEGKPIGRCITLCDYRGEGPDELSYRKGEIVEVLATSMDGWWKVRSSAGNVGVTPAINLQQLEEELVSCQQTDEDKAIYSAIKESLHQHSLYNKAPPPRRNTPTKKEHHSVIFETNEEQPSVQYTEVCFDNTTSGLKKPIVRHESAVAYSEIIPKTIQPRTNLKKVQDKPLSYENTDITQGASQLYSEVIKPKTSKPVETKQSPKQSPVAAQRSLESSPVPAPRNQHHHSPELPHTGIEGHHYENCKPKNQYENVSMGNTDKTPSRPQDFKEGLVIPTINTPSRSPQVARRKFQGKGNDVAPVHQHQGPPASALRQRRNSIDPPPMPDLPSPKLPHNMHSPIKHLSTELHYTSIVALCGYQSDRNSIFSFSKGDVGLLVHQSSQGWWYINMGGIDGWVPGDYWEVLQTTSPRTSPKNSPRPSPESSPSVPRKAIPLAETSASIKKLVKDAWNYGKISRHDCESLLLRQGEQRDFMVRESMNRVGDYTLSVKYEDRVRHFPIETTSEGKYYIGKHNFRSLAKIISYYQHHPLFYDDNHVAVSLGHALNAKT